MSLTKVDLIRALVKENRFNHHQSTELIETLIELIKAKLISGEDVMISGFGKFCVRKKKERRGRNPATGKDMVMEARRVVTFKWSGRLRENINKS